MVMVRGTRVIEHPEYGTRVQISKAAQESVGEDVLTGFVEDLMEFMQANGFKWAYVGVQGTCLYMTLGWRRT